MHTFQLCLPHGFLFKENKALHICDLDLFCLSLTYLSKMFVYLKGNIKETIQGTIKITVSVIRKKGFN